MLLRDHSPRDTLYTSVFEQCVNRYLTYRTQHCGHELVCLVRLHEVAHLEHANRQARYDGSMLLQGLLQYLAVLVIVFDRSNLGDATKALESLQVRFVHVGEVGVRNDNIGESLNVAQAVCKSTSFSKSYCITVDVWYLVGSSSRQ